MILVSLILSVLTLIFLYVKYIYSYWKRHGFEYIPPKFPFGNFTDSMLVRKSIPENLTDLYYATDKPFIGFYMLYRPTLLIRGPEFLRCMMVKDFDHFVDRGFFADEKRDPLSAHLLALSGDQWRFMRHKISPALTSGKLRQMMPQFLKIGERLNEYLHKSCAESDSVIEVTEIFARYTTDVIASVAFGIEVDSINNEKEMFREIGQKATRPDFLGSLRLGLSFMSPGLMDFFKIKSVPSDVERFMMAIVGQTIHHREMTGEKREDFIQLMIQLRNGGEMNEGNDWNAKVVAENQKTLSIGQICAQAFVFFVAGFETTSTMMSYFIFELAKNQEIQKRVQKEVGDVLRKYDGVITYENIKEMTYLEMCVKETLRMHPSAPMFMQKCVKDYPIPGTDLVLPKGAACMVSLSSLHNDPKYFKDPEKFDPERFSPENKDKIIPYTYIPFGEGPRNCIGMRLSVIQSRVALAAILSKFQFELGPGQNRKVKLDPKSVFLGAEGGIHLRIRLRK